MDGYKRLIANACLGTGKSFIGALLAKIIHDFTKQTILVVCYTNHALDQFLEDLLDIGISGRSMVRLGGKSTARTESLALQKQQSTFKFAQADWSVIDRLKIESNMLCKSLEAAFRRYKSSNIQYQDILTHLEFEDTAFFEAFRVPKNADGTTQVGKNGRAVGTTYLLYQWANGRNAGMFQSHVRVREAPKIWGMVPAARQAQLTKWKDAIFEEQITCIVEIANEYNKRQSEHEQKFSERSADILRSKRIIGCTTTAAAKYSDVIQAASPDVLLVEEAGEILESHVLTALGKDKDQLILIGDHKYDFPPRGSTV